MFGAEHLDGFLGGKDPDVPGHWQDHIKNSGYVLFGLYHDNKMIGSSSILFRADEAVFTGLIIDVEYRRQGLSDHLHDVRKRYLNDIDYHGPVITEILSGNSASIKAAERNGFQYSSSKETDGVTYKVYELK